MLRLRWKTPPLSFRVYLATLRQLQRPESDRIVARSVAAMVLRSTGRGKPMIARLPTAERVAAVLTPRQQSLPGRAHWPEPEFLAAAAGLPLRSIERLHDQFDRMSAIVAELAAASYWERCKLLARHDPSLARRARVVRRWWPRPWGVE